MSAWVCVCVCLHVMCPDVGVHAESPLKLLILYPPLPRVSAFFEDHVAMIIKGALVPLQTYAMNMDTTDTFHLHTVDMDLHDIIVLQLQDLLTLGAS